MQYPTKRIIVNALHLITWPLTIPSLIGYKIFHSEEIFSFCSKAISLIPGLFGQYIRASFYCQTLNCCAYDLAIGFCSYFAHPNVNVGRKVGTGSFTIIGTVDIGSNVLIASRVSLLSGKYQHDLADKTDIGSPPDSNLTRISIGSNSWIGENSVIMADVGNNCIVSAGSVVTKPMPDDVTAIGNPARFLRADFFQKKAKDNDRSNPE